MAFVQSLSKNVSVFVLGLVLLNCFSVDKFGSHAQVAPLLPEDEVQILKTISSKLQNSNWTIDRTSCGSAQWNLTIVGGDKIQSQVTCDCTFNSSTVCHVISFKMKGFNLTGFFPSEFRNLTHLREIDLTRNYINGSIPASLAELPNLQTLSLLANRITGSIPREFGSMATLESLVLEDNLLGGSLHPDLGNLRSLKRLLLSANNFTGTIPDTFGNLKNLTDFRIDGSELSGKIPNFIGNWTNIERLDLQGTSMEGPIPSTISLLKKLEELRISDLNGSSSTFPDLKDMKNMTTLILRSCSLNGTIPEYIGDMASLDTLDLSFNKFTGQIPVSLESLAKLRFMFLNNNLLTGEVPGWILNSKNELDLSYNNFTGSTQSSCQQLSVNLVSSHVTTGNNTISWCLNKDLVCSRKPEHHSLFINCGGNSMTVGDNEYEEDATSGGAAEFVSLSERWGYSSTGTYMNNDGAGYKAENSFGLNVTGEGFYQTARLAPQSLKYYALCMRAGSYKVKLHFAEIMYSNDSTFSSLGRRIFDISIQGEVVRKDFNIMEKAGGVGIGIAEEFDSIIVNGSTLEIDLYWSGKGTTAVPDRGVYGPLISAITVTPNFKVDNGDGLSVGAIIGIVAASCVLAALALLVLWRKGYLGGKYHEDKDLRALDLQTGYFSLRQIKNATNNFDPANKIGEGGFGPVYKGVLSDGTIIAVKQLSSKSKQGNREFVNEIGMISALQHPHLVKLYGCCIEGNQLLVVYEYLENNSLARALFGRDEHQIKMDWQTRKKILLGIAKGLAYLHEESRLKIVHRDIKATNVLLDKDLNAKISDFGLAKLDEEENTHISTRIAGTIGYMAPEYAMRGYLTDKADVYSFGVVVLEIVSGKSNTNYRPKEEFVYLLDWAYVLQEQGNLLELVDPNLGSNYSEEEAMRMLNLALLCTNPSPSLRPLMSSAVSMIEGQIPVQAPIVKRGTMNEEARFKAFELLSQDSQAHVSNTSQSSLVQKSISMDGPWMDSEISTQTMDETRGN
ncbi:hypothetical protein POPTR_011G106400v4 [Populus trichocarpa]|uniref:Uncharacterized protein n=1 Tax=Populus trichocarpa TaxID=3694 RepID=A0ACC0SA00_POPTR|nr:probable LRR receptor-like serine/threonine-protein kinase At1g53440 [Populus trichocarpa]KAI9385735.1 hypothetical protein POPTR_011G106400v4 [Populus trichocarpa]